MTQRTTAGTMDRAAQHFEADFERLRDAQLEPVVMVERDALGWTATIYARTELCADRAGTVFVLEAASYAALRERLPKTLRRVPRGAVQGFHPTADIYF